MLTCEIELTPSGKKIGLNLLYDEDFSFPYVLMIQSQIHQLATKF